MSNDEKFSTPDDEPTSRPTGQGTNPTDLPQDGQSYVVRFTADGSQTDPETAACEEQLAEVRRLNRPELNTPLINSLDDLQLEQLLSGDWGNTDGEDLDALYESGAASAMPMIDVVLIHLDENGVIDPLATMMTFTDLGIRPSDVPFMLELLRIITTPFAPGISYIMSSFGMTPQNPFEEIIAKMDADAINVPPLIPLAMYTVDDNEITEQNQSPFTRLSEHRRAYRTAQLDAMREGGNFRSAMHPAHGTAADALRRHARWHLSQAPLFGALIAAGNAAAADLTPEERRRAEESRNMLTAWQTGTNRARAEFDPYIEDLDSDS